MNEYYLNLFIEDFKNIYPLHYMLVYETSRYEICELIHVHPYAVKQSFDLEEYSLSQSTLEQVGHS